MNPKLIAPEPPDDKWHIVDEFTGEIIHEALSEYEAQTFLKSYQSHHHRAVKQNIGSPPQQIIKDIFGGN